NRSSNQDNVDNKSNPDDELDNKHDNEFYDKNVTNDNPKDIMNFD
ncbi:10434_t:CDS:1, partial [Cetraspora pellucida]